MLRSINMLVLRNPAAAACWNAITIFVLRPRLVKCSAVQCSASSYNSLRVETSNYDSNQQLFGENLWYHFCFVIIIWTLSLKLRKTISTHNKVGLFQDKRRNFKSQMIECKTFYFCSEEWERLKRWRWRRMVDVNQGGSAAAAWWQHRKGSITELTDSMLQPRAGYTYTLDTGASNEDSRLNGQQNTIHKFGTLAQRS